MFPVVAFDHWFSSPSLPMAYVVHTYFQYCRSTISSSDLATELSSNHRGKVAERTIKSFIP
jgi:hypothetical protein